MGVDYTPDFKPYKNAGRFRYWCQTTIPLVYDDSKSYLELLYSVISYLNSTIEDVAAMGENTDALLEAYNQLQTYVNDYFDNLDVQEEINNKLDALVEDGTIPALLAPIVEALGNPVVVTDLSQMQDPEKLYILSSSGAMYYYNGSEFVPSGVTYGNMANLPKYASAIVAFTEGNAPVFDYVAKTIQFKGGFVLYNGQRIATSIHTVTLPTDQYGAYMLYLSLSSRNFYAVSYTSNTNANNDPPVGIIYEARIWINGIDNVILSNTTRTEARLGNAIYGTTPNSKIALNGNTLTIPQGFVMYEGVGQSIAQQDIDISAYTSATVKACVFKYHYATSEANRTIYSVEWNGARTNNDPIIGWYYNGTVSINGIDDTGLATPAVTSMIDNKAHAYVASIDGQPLVYNFETYEVTFPQGFCCFNGRTYSVNAQTIQLSGSSLNAYALYYKVSTRTPYAVPYGTANDAGDPCIGWAYRRNIFVNGITDYYKRLNKICFFGDSITAGVGASAPFHVDVKQALNAICYNWGVGSTGYVTTFTGTVRSGQGVEGQGASVTVLGNNNVFSVMQTVASFDACVIEAGTNDWGSNVPLADFRTAVGSALDYAQSVTPKVCALSPIRRESASGVNGLSLTLAQYGEVIREECEARGIAFIDGYDIALNPNNAVSKTAFFADGIHPNNAGHKRIAQAVLAKIKEVIL